MTKLKYRVALILALVAVSVWALFPRSVTERVRTRDGSYKDTVVTRVPLKRGLDLQGGIHLALEVDESKGAVADKSAALDNALKVVRNRVDQFGVSEPLVQKAGEERIIVELPGIDDPERATQLVQKAAFLEFQITDETGAYEKVAPRLDGILRERGLLAAAPAGTRDSAGRPASPGVGGLFSQGDSAAPAAAGDSARPAGDSAAARDTGLLAGGATDRTGPFTRDVQAGQFPGEYLVESSKVDAFKRYLGNEAIRAALPPGKEILWSNDSLALGGQVYKLFYMVDSRPIITGEYLTDAKPTVDPVEGTKVDFTFTTEGGRRFRNETGRHIRDYMAIVLDEVVQGRPPVIQSAIGNRGQITLGGRGLQEAQDLATVLKAGSLPVPLKVAEARNIGASLGQDSIDKAMLAGSIAVALIVIIMVGYYRFSGMLAVAALVLYMLYTLAVLAGFDAVLTLPGLAGFVLSIGIAVDANVLIFERMREELDRGKTNRVAVDEGFRHALSAIVDTSITTILTAAVLYQYGSGPVRGFAVTLIAGIAASLFTAVFVTRTFFLLWLDRNRGTQPLSI